MASQNFINECRNSAYKNRLGKIIKQRKINGYDIYGKTTQDGTPTPDNPQEIKTVKGWNIFNTEFEQGARNNTDGSSLISSANYIRTKDKIEVKPSTTYTIKSVSEKSVNGGDIHYYDKSKNFISRDSIGINSTKTAPSNCYYINIQYYLSTGITPSDIKTTMINKGTTPLSYLPYNNIAVKITGKNLFDREKETKNAYINETGTTGTSSVSSVSSYIKIKANKTYNITWNYDSLLNTSTRTICFYDNNYTLKGYSVVSMQSKNKSFIREIEGYVRFAYDKNCINIQLEEGNITPYESYKESISYINLKDNELCKIGDVKDKININKNGNVTLTKRIGKVVLNGSESWEMTYGTGMFNIQQFFTGHISKGLSNYFVYNNVQSGIYNTLTNGEFALQKVNVSGTLKTNIFMKYMNITNVNDFKTWLSTHNVEVYYQLAEEQIINLGNIDIKETNNSFKFDKIINIYLETTFADNDIDTDIDEYEEYTNNDYITEIKLEDGCYVNGAIIGTVVGKKVDFNTLNTINMEDKDYEAYVGVKFNDTEQEYVKLGEYTTTTQTIDKTSKNSNIEGIDYIGKLDNVYNCGIEEFNNVTVKDLLIDLCSQIGIELGTNSFINDNLSISGDNYQNNVKIRDVLSDICEVSCTYAEIGEDNKLYLSWFDTNITETINKSQYSTLERNGTYGVVNSLVIKDGAFEGENVVREDTSSIEENGETQVAIIDNQILNTEELRQQAIDNIWNKIKGFTYVDCKIISYTGMPYLKRGNKIKVQDDDETYFETYVLQHNFKYDGTFYSEISSPSLSKEETVIKNTTTSVKNRIANAEATVKKADAEIKLLTNKIETMEDNISTVENRVETIQTDTYTKTEIQKIIKGTSEDGTVVESISNTSGVFDKDGLTIEQSIAETKTNINANGMIIYNKTGSIDNPLLTVNKTGVIAENVRVNTYLNIGKHSRIEDYEDGTGIFYVNL